MDIRVGNAGERRQVEDGVRSLERGAYSFRIANISRNNSDVFCARRQQIQETGGVARVIADERSHIRAQALHQVAADEAPGPGDHNISAALCHIRVEASIVSFPAAANKRE
jgi:hypothetical protein